MSIKLPFSGDVKSFRRERQIEEDGRLIARLESKLSRAGFARRARYGKRIRAAMVRIAANRLLNS